MQTVMKLVALVFVFATSCCSANSTLGSLGARAANKPELHQHLKQELQQWTVGSSNPNRKLLQGGSQGDNLLLAVKSLDISVVERLLRAGADPNYANEEGIDVLAVAIIKDRGDVVTLLINAGADIKGTSGSLLSEFAALNTAALYDSTDAAAALLAAGAPINGINSAGYSPLHDCAYEGAINLAELLLNNGAAVDLYTTTKDPVTALHVAAVAANLSIVKLLLSRGADANSRAKQSGDTPLHDAAQENSAAVAQELLDNGADIDATNNSGVPPLWHAALLGNKNTLEVLVMNGADKSIKAFDLTPREALCLCTSLNDVPRQCKLEECKNPARMEQLLIG